jgi:hypothetical protein
MIYAWLRRVSNSSSDAFDLMKREKPCENHEPFGLPLEPRAGGNEATGP